MWRACLFTLATAIVVITILAAAPPEAATDKPQYNKSGELQRPENFREWIFLSAGYGMNYSPAPGSHDMFTDVFVPRFNTLSIFTVPQFHAVSCVAPYAPMGRLAITGWFQDP